MAAQSEAPADAAEPISANLKETLPADSENKTQTESELKPNESITTDSVSVPGEATVSEEETPLSESEDVPCEEKSFDTAMEKMPVSFLGHNEALLFSVLNREVRGKDEFETKEEYNKRIEDIPEKTLYGEMTVLSTYAFLSLWYKPELKYNAETQQAEISFPHELERYRDKLIDNYPNDIYALPTNSSTEDLGSYTGTNKFGASIEVTKSKIKIYQLLLEIPASKSSRPSFKPQLLNLSPDAARDAKNNLGMMILFQIATYQPESNLERNPTISMDILDKDATFDSPKEIEFIFYGIYAKDLQFWFFNMVTGEIYLKRNLSDMLQ